MLVFRCRFSVSITVYVLAIVGYFKNVSPMLAPKKNRITKLEALHLSPYNANTLLGVCAF